MALQSLRVRLFAFMLVLAAITSIGVGWATYASVRVDADELFDYHLRQMALSLRDQGHVAENERAALADPDLDYVVQIWSVEGTALYSSLQHSLKPPLPPRTVLGYSEVQANGETWRVFGAATSQRVVQVGQPLAVRRRFAAAAAWRSVLPIMAAAPLIALALWWLVGFSLAPLRGVVTAARSRDAASLQPLPDAGLPTELQPLVRAFNDLLAQLALALQAQRAFVADAAHELRTPLTALKLQIGLLGEGAPEAERPAALARLRAGVDRAARIVEQLLMLARAEPGNAMPMERIDLAQVARQAIAEAAPLAALRQAQVQLDAPASLVLQGNAQALRSLLRNLVDNAIKYGGDAPCVRVSLAEQAGMAVLCVDDQGPGVPAAEREHLFDRFHRRDGSAGEGSGLGLAIVRAVAQQHGGQAELGDAPGGGLRAEVRLPIASSLAPPLDPAVAAAATSPP